MKKIISIVLLGLLCLQGCEKDPSEGTTDAPGPRSFAPRDVNYMWMIVQSTSYLSIGIATHNHLLEEKNWPACYLDTWMNVDAPIAAVEERSRKHHQRFSYIRIIPIEEQVTYLEEYPEKHPSTQFDGPLYPMLIEYRTEGIAELKITANRPLFGKAAGASLNDHFAMQLSSEKIDHIPDFSTVDFEEIDFSREQLFGFEPNDYNMVNLNSWLGRNPTTPEEFAIIALEPFLGEGEEPVTITVELTTTKGKRFISTQQAQTTPFEGGLKGEHIYREEFLATRLDK